MPEDNLGYFSTLYLRLAPSVRAMNICPIFGSDCLRLNISSLDQRPASGHSCLIGVFFSLDLSFRTFCIDISVFVISAVDRIVMVCAIYKALFDLKSGRVCYLPSGRDHVVSVDLNDVFIYGPQTMGTTRFLLNSERSFLLREKGEN